MESSTKWIMETHPLEWRFWLICLASLQICYLVTASKCCSPSKTKFLIHDRHCTPNKEIPTLLITPLQAHTHSLNRKQLKKLSQSKNQLTDPLLAKPNHCKPRTSPLTFPIRSTKPINDYLKPLHSSNTNGKYTVMDPPNVKFYETLGESWAWIKKILLNSSRSGHGTLHLA